MIILIYLVGTLTQQNGVRYRQSPWIGAHEGLMYIFQMPNSEIVCAYLFIIFGDFASYIVLLIRLVGSLTSARFEVGMGFSSEGACVWSVCLSYGKISIFMHLLY